MPPPHPCRHTRRTFRGPIWRAPPKAKLTTAVFTATCGWVLRRANLFRHRVAEFGICQLQSTSADLCERMGRDDDDERRQCRRCQRPRPLAFRPLGCRGPLARRVRGLRLPHPARIYARAQLSQSAVLVRACVRACVCD
eukprot:9482401-Pyramimonas_sp.AAC.2